MAYEVPTDTFLSTRMDSYHSDDSNGPDSKGRQDDIVIGVMGSTGTGKSSFIRLLSGDTSVHVGDSLESETSDVQAINFRDPISGRNVIIADTPGFDDSRDGISDTDILKKITEFLLTAYDTNRKLNGLIYVQRISDPRFGGQSSRNLRMFRNLCGTQAYQNVVVLTTYWDKVTEELGTTREDQLKARFFKDIAQGGGRFMRHNQTHESTNHVLQYLLSLVPTNVQIQEEIRVEGRNFEETSAGSVRREELERIITKHKEEVAELKAQLDGLQGSNEELRKELKEEQAKLQRFEAEKEDLKTPGVLKTVFRAFGWCRS